MITNCEFDAAVQLLAGYQRIMKHIHEGGNIYYNEDRMEAYALIAKLASDLRKAVLLPNIFGR